jgi:hypothetical protein
MPALLTEAWLFAATTPDAAPMSVPVVHGRLTCPDSGGVRQVRLAVDPVSGERAVIACDRFAQPPLACSRACVEQRGRSVR